VVDAAQRGRTAAQLTGWTAILVALLVWAAGFAAYVAHLAIGHSEGNRGCEYPRGSSHYGHASWQWWYPGTRCTYAAVHTARDPVAAHVDAPSGLSGAAAVGLIVWPALWCSAGVAVAMRRRRPGGQGEDHGDPGADEWPWGDGPLDRDR